MTPVFAFDTSAFINGWHYHYPPAVFAGVWTLIEGAMVSGLILSPREVYKELGAKDDDLKAWSRQYSNAFINPDQQVQLEAGKIQAHFPDAGVRDVADPWVIAEAKVKGLTVVTYEGRSFSGVPTLKASTKMPGICQIENVPCVTLPEALQALGGNFP